MYMLPELDDFTKFDSIFCIEMLHAPVTLILSKSDLLKEIYETRNPLLVS